MINNSVFIKRYSYLKYKKKLYTTNITDQQQDIASLKKFNKVWSESYMNIPFYKYWKNTHSLPNLIKNFDELYNFPILTSEIIQKHEDLINLKGPKNSISTGGSTGRPTLFPKSDSNLNDFYANIYVGRGWWNVLPNDKTLLIWGHSHLFGSGISGRFKEYIRIIKDLLTNTIRVNAYDMSDRNLKSIYKSLIKSKPRVIIGYTSVLVKLAEYISRNKHNNKNFNLKAVIPTAETITPYDIACLKDTFLCPVAIEYGMAEAGVIAYSYKTTNNLKILYNSFICSIKSNELIITTLDRDEFPLINYGTKDIVDTCDKNLKNIKNLTSIKGRKKDFYEINNVSNNEIYTVSGIFIVHAIKSYGNILSVQVKEIDKNKLNIFIVSHKKIDLIDLKYFFFNQTKNDFPNIDMQSFVFTQINDTIKSLSGKTNITIS
jgi:phenylacetate-coenzyme A ligase PaaK-like adenylate-forming protein